MFFTSGIISLAGAAVVAVFQPYKVKAHNTIDTILLLLMGVYFISYYAMILLTSLRYSFEWLIAAVCESVSVFFIILYLIFLLLWKLLHLKLLALIKKAKSAWSSRESNEQSINEEFIDSFDWNRDEAYYPPLLARSQ